MAGILAGGPISQRLDIIASYLNSSFYLYFIFILTLFNIFLILEFQKEKSQALSKLPASLTSVTSFVRF